MSTLGGALQIGRSGILASRTAIDVIGNNLANVSTDGYHRRSVQLTPIQGQELVNGIFVDRGVQISQIVRNISDALESRLRSSVSDSASSQVRRDVLTQIEAIENELADNDLSSQLAAFFDAWSELANTPDDASKRTLVIEQARSLASFTQNLRSSLIDLRNQIGQDARDAVTQGNQLLDQIAELNVRIGQVERGSGGASSLRDERDRLLGELSQYVDISTVEQQDGRIDVFVGSIPVILGNRNRGLALRSDLRGDRTDLSLVLQQDGSPLLATSGRIRGLLDARDADVRDAVTALDDFASALIYQVNRIHSQSQALTPVSSVTGTTVVADASALLNSSAAGIPFAIRHGSFQIHLTQQTSGQRTSTAIDIDLDGIDADNDATLNSLVAALNAVDHVSATVSATGQLVIRSDSDDFRLSFSHDSSGVLAALGVNGFFQGSDAATIAISSNVGTDPQKLAAAQGHVAGDNRAALAIAGLRTQALDDLGGISISDQWNQHVAQFAVRMGQSRAQAEADQLVQGHLESQQQQLSGVNIDEETINLLAFQRAFQGSARFLSVVDELLQTLMQLV